MMRENTLPAPDMFSKRVDLSDGGLAFHIECEKARLAYEILRDHKYFYTPLLKKCDSTRGLLVFENIEAMEPFSCNTDRVWFSRAGELLALVHDRLHLPNEISIVRRKDVGRKGNVCVHGDFMPNNLCISRQKLVVFDWGLRPWTSQLFTVASPAVDLAAFIAPWWIPIWWNFRFPADKLKLFLQSYFKRAELDYETIRSLRRQLRKEFFVHKLYHQGEIQKRPLWKRPLHRTKLFINFYRTIYGIING